MKRCAVFALSLCAIASAMFAGGGREDIFGNWEEDADERLTMTRHAAEVDVASSSAILLFSTHLWGPGIEEATTRAKAEAEAAGVDFCVLFQRKDTSGPPEELLRSFPVVSVTESEVRAMYPVGFNRLRTESHWILMWWHKHHNVDGRYATVWRMEYDVRWAGSLASLWHFRPDADVAFVHGLEPIVSRGVLSHTTPGWVKPTEVRTALWQVARFSAKFLDYLHDRFTAGENSQDEVALGTHAYRSGVEIADLSSIDCIDSTWSCMPWKTKVATSAWQKACIDGTCLPLRFFHPIKDRDLKWPDDP